MEEVIHLSSLLTLRSGANKPAGSGPQRSWNVSNQLLYTAVSLCVEEEHLHVLSGNLVMASHDMWPALVV